MMNLDGLALALMVWLGPVTGLPVPLSAPAIEFFAAPPHVSDAYTVRAYYNPITRRIYLSQSWREDVLTDRAGLVHELTHHMQFMAGRGGRCHGDLEKQAYEAEMAFLHAAGDSDPFRTLGLSRILYYMITSCQSWRR